MSPVFPTSGALAMQRVTLSRAAGVESLLALAADLDATDATGAALARALAERIGGRS